jgi:hypothetical protein
VEDARAVERAAAESAAEEESSMAEARLDDALAHVERAEGEATDLKRTLSQRARTIGRLQSELKTLKSTPSTRPTESPETQDDPRLSGTLKTTWVLTSQLKPWPTGCTGAQGSYQVRVTDGAGATVTIAGITSSRVGGRSEKNGVLSLTCLLTYTAQIPDPLGSVYEFVAVSESEPDVNLNSALVQSGSLRDGTGPELYVSFCPEC